MHAVATVYKWQWKGRFLGNVSFSVFCVCAFLFLSHCIDCTEWFISLLPWAQLTKDQTFRTHCWCPFYRDSTNKTSPPKNRQLLCVSLWTLTLATSEISLPYYIHYYMIIYKLRIEGPANGCICFQQRLYLQTLSHRAFLWDCIHIQLIKVARRDKSSLKLNYPIRMCIGPLWNERAFSIQQNISCWLCALPFPFKAFVVEQGDRWRINTKVLSVTVSQHHPEKDDFPDWCRFLLR